MPDITMGLFDYSETDNHAPFTLALQSNLADGSGGGQAFRFIGDEGAITVQGRSLILSKSPRRRPPDEAVFKGYNSVRTFSEAQQKAFVKAYFDSIRNGTPVYEDVVYGYRAAAPSLLCNLSLFNKQIYQWDPEGMQLRT